MQFLFLFAVTLTFHMLWWSYCTTCYASEVTTPQRAIPDSLSQTNLGKPTVIQWFYGKWRCETLKQEGGWTCNFYPFQLTPHHPHSHASLLSPLSLSYPPHLLILHPLLCGRRTPNSPFPLSHQHRQPVPPFPLSDLPRFVSPSSPQLADLTPPPSLSSRSTRSLAPSHVTCEQEPWSSHHQDNMNKTNKMIPKHAWRRVQSLHQWVRIEASTTWPLH